MRWWIQRISLVATEALEVHLLLEQRMRRSLFASLAIFVLACRPAGVSAQETTHVIEDGQALQQWAPQFVWLWRRLNLQIATAKRVCELSDEQLTQLAAFDADWLQELLSANDELLGSDGSVVLPQFAGNGGVVQRRAEGRSTTTYVRDALALVDKHFKRVLTEKQYATLSDETKARAAFRAKTVAMATVNNIQRRIFLDAERRENLRKEIAKWAATQDELYALMYASHPQTIPNLPRSLLNTVFSQEEILQLNALRRISMPAIPYESQMFQHETAIVFDEGRAK